MPYGTKVNQCELTKSDGSYKCSSSGKSLCFRMRWEHTTAIQLVLWLTQWSVPRIEDMFVWLADCQKFTKTELRHTYLPLMLLEVAKQCIISHSCRSGQIAESYHLSPKHYIPFTLLKKFRHCSVQDHLWPFLNSRSMCTNTDQWKSSSTPVTSDLSKRFHQICLWLHQLVKSKKSTEDSVIYDYYLFYFI